MCGILNLNERSLGMQFLFISVVLGLFCGTSGTIMSDLVDQKYERNMRPNANEGAVNVTVQIEIIALGPIDENTFTYNIDYYQRLWWYDGRLNNTLDKNHAREIMLSNSPGDIIWTPSIVVENSVKTEADKKVRTIIDIHGNIYMGRRLKSTCTCKMDLRHYPLDRQTCPFSIEDFAYKNDKLRLFWHTRNPILYASNMGKEIAGYTLLGIHTSKTERYYEIGSVMESFDRLLLQLKLGRLFYYYLYRVYIPSILLMVFNMASYWVPDTAVPARVGLIVTTFLTNTLILQSVTERTVQVPYTTALQIFLLGNVVLLVISIVEYLLVLYLKAISKVKKQKKIVSHETNACEIDIKCNGTKEKQKTPFYKMFIFFRRRIKAEDTHNLDRVSRLLFPVCFLIFCSVYFTHFLKEI